MGRNLMAQKYTIIGLLVMLFASLLMSGCLGLPETASIDTEEKRHQKLIGYLEEQVNNNEYIETLKLNEYSDYNRTSLSALMSDAFYEKTLEEQYNIIAAIYDGYVYKTNRLRIYKKYTRMYVQKSGNENNVYYISEIDFFLINLNNDYRREFIISSGVLNKISKERVLKDKITVEPKTTTKTSSTTNTQMSGYRAYSLSEKQKTEAWIAAQYHVKNKLKSPSTAKFPGFRDELVTVSGGNVVVNAWVDAQNEYGATLRREYKCVMEGEHPYHVISITIYE